MPASEAVEEDPADDWARQAEALESGPAAMAVPLPSPHLFPQMRPQQQPVVMYAPRGPRQVRPNNSSGTDRITPWLLILFIVATILNIVLRIIETSSWAEPPSKGLMLGIGFGWLISFAILVAPLTLLAVFITSKIMAFELPENSYIRIAGISSVPQLLVMAVGYISPGERLSLLAAVIAALPACYFMLKFVFDMTYVEAAIAMIFSSIFYAVGTFLSILAVVGVLIVTASRGGAAALGGLARPPTSGGSGSLLSSASTPNSPRSSGAASSGSSQVDVPAYDPYAREVDDLMSRVNRISAENQGPESALKELTEVERQFRQKKSLRPEKSGWGTVERGLAFAKGEIDKMPPTAPPAELFQPMVATAPFSAIALPNNSKVGEVSIGPWKFRPPEGTPLDLRASKVNENLYCFGTGAFPKMKIRLVPKVNPRQMRPYAPQKGYQKRAGDDQRLLMIDSPGGTNDIQYGLLGKTTFAKTERFELPMISYIASSGDNWLIVTIPVIHDPLASSGVMASLESFRPAQTEPFVSPLAVEFVADQLGSEASIVAPIMLANKAAAEPFVIKFLSSDDFRTRREALKLLSAVATAKSIPQLEPLLASEDRELVAAVRPVLRTLDPNRFNEVIDAIAVLKKDRADMGRGFHEVDKAYDALAGAKPDEKYRAEVAQLLEDALLDTNRNHFGSEKAARALCIWAGPKTAARLAPVLNDPKLWGSRRDHFILAMSGANDKLAAVTIMKWIIQSPESVRAALIRMGPIAEDETLRIFGLNFTAKTKDATSVRASCVYILREIGTAKSLELLGRASRDPRDASTQLAAKDAIDTVKARIAAAPPATKPAGK